jgi:hypothetical protein
MRTVHDALEYIDTMVSYCLERPDMYAANPLDLEGILTLLDNLAAFLRSDDAYPICVHRSRYSEFLKSKGFGAFGFAHQPDDPALVLSDRAAFGPLCEFWREYLSVRDQPSPFPPFPYD